MIPYGVRVLSDPQPFRLSLQRGDTLQWWDPAAGGWVRERPEPIEPDERPGEWPNERVLTVDATPAPAIVPVTAYLHANGAPLPCAAIACTTSGPWPHYSGL